MKGADKGADKERKHCTNTEIQPRRGGGEEMKFFASFGCRVRRFWKCHFYDWLATQMVEQKRWVGRGVGESGRRAP